MRKPMLVLALVVACLSVIAAGCGGGDDNDNNASNSGAQGNGADETQSTTTSESASSGGGGDATKLKLTADPGGALKFDKTELSAKPGKVTVTMDNPSSVPHAVEIEGNGVEEETKTLTDGTASVTVDLKAGKYEFYCPVDGHKEAGMKGTLTVG
jgi:plastocyanin